MFFEKKNKFYVKKIQFTKNTKQIQEKHNKKYKKHVKQLIRQN